VRQDFGEVGSRSLRVLVDTIGSRAHGSAMPVGSLVAPEFVLRASTTAVTGSPPTPLPGASRLA
jgi:hypothetical protein